MKNCKYYFNCFADNKMLHPEGAKSASFFKKDLSLWTRLLSWEMYRFDRVEQCSEITLENKFDSSLLYKDGV